ncbi:MAG: hydantoinase/oxoprolinase family protein [Synergistaceae bacterium]|nr:hydantoinase/oxoprolinase family protein [Synergistaceae bacterium]
MSDKGAPRYNIGIDVGGTNTDGVLYDSVKKKIAASVKIPTVHSSYAKAIENSLKALLGSCGNNSSEVASLNISTTVSTNALLEGSGENSNLILIGFDRYPHIVSDIEMTIRPLSLLKVSGGHTGWGKERESFDREAVEKFAKGREGELFTVSSFYSPRNPEHETAAKRILLSNGSGHVTCSHELSYSKLNSVKRTVTAYLNTSLVPLANRLLDDISFVVKKYKITCPVMFLRSDSTLVPSEWCRRFPIEMIYSGPAASLKGAYYIAGNCDQSSFIVADIGGTSTDIGRIEKGRAVFSEEGARIGSYRTMIPSLDIMSIALGGDSRIEISEAEEIRVGPERSVPLCITSEEIGLSVEDLNLKHSSGSITATPEHVKPLPCRTEDLCRSGPGKWFTEEFSYTPTDAFNTMGLSEVGNTGISKAASCLMGKRYKMSGFDLAKQISAKTNSVLGCSIKEYESRCGTMPRIYVGTPAKVFAELEENKEPEIIVPENFDIAGAVGAAVSSIELSCRVFIMHSFSEENFTAFLPEATISSDNFQELLVEAEESGKRYLAKLARKMGFPETRVITEKNFNYVGQTENIASLLSVSMELRAVQDITQ